jgi:cytochrome c5
MSGRRLSSAACARRAFAATLLLITLVVATLSLGAGAPAAPGRRPAYAATFPAGPGQSIAERACLFCHSPMLVTQQAKDSTGWEKTLAQMEKWGAPMTPAEHDTLRVYLLAHFGPRPLSN